MTPKVAAIIPAAGSGQRLGGGQPKALRRLGGSTLLEHCIRALASHPSVAQIVVVAPPEEVAAITEDLPDIGAETAVVPGGRSRQASVAAGLRATDPSCGIVLVHDAARPLVPLTLVERVIDAVSSGAPAAVPGLPVADTIKQVDDSGIVLATPPRHELRAIQTPQGFRREVLAGAHRRAGDQHTATDDAALVEAAGYPVLVVAGARAAMKITTPEDLELAELLVATETEA